MLNLDRLGIGEMTMFMYWWCWVWWRRRWMIYRGMSFIWWSLYVFILYNIVFYMFFIISNWVWVNWEWCERGGIIRDSNFTWLPLFSREWTILETKRSSWKMMFSHKSWLDLKNLSWNPSSSSKFLCPELVLGTKDK